MVDLEHYFDGYEFDKEYTLECCWAAVDGGAEVLVMCDTNGECWISVLLLILYRETLYMSFQSKNMSMGQTHLILYLQCKNMYYITGGSMPWQIEQITKESLERIPSTTFGIHCHNDCGLAVANSLTAVQSGVGVIQGTINGIGERTGNADLCSIVPSLSFHCGCKQMNCKDNLEEITSLSRYLDETLNRTPDRGAPYVGASAFAHKGGLHAAALERSPDSYQHVEPANVGNELRVLISELSGRQNILGKIKKLDLDIGDRDDGEKYVNERALVILNRVKKLESMGCESYFLFSDFRFAFCIVAVFKQLNPLTPHYSIH